MNERKNVRIVFSSGTQLILENLEPHHVARLEDLERGSAFRYRTGHGSETTILPGQVAYFELTHAEPTGSDGGAE